MGSILHHVEICVKDEKKIITQLIKGFGFYPYAMRVTKMASKWVLKSGDSVFIVTKRKFGFENENGCVFENGKQFDFEIDEEKQKFMETEEEEQKYMETEEKEQKYEEETQKYRKTENKKQKYMENKKMCGVWENGGVFKIQNGHQNNSKTSKSTEIQNNGPLQNTEALQNNGLLQNNEALQNQTSDEFESDPGIEPEHWTIFCCSNEALHKTDSVFNIALVVDDLDSVTRRVLSRGGILLKGPCAIKNIYGSVRYAIVSSCSGNIVHTLIDKKNYMGAFLPGYEMVGEGLLNGDMPGHIASFSNSNSNSKRSQEVQYASNSKTENGIASNSTTVNEIASNSKTENGIASNSKTENHESASNSKTENQDIASNSNKNNEIASFSNSNSKISQETQSASNSKTENNCKRIVNHLNSTIINVEKYPYINTKDLWPEGAPNSSFIDHVTYVIEEGRSSDIINWYEYCLGMKRFKTNRDESDENGFVLEGDIGIRLKAMQYWKCSEVGLVNGISHSVTKSTFKLVLAEPIPGVDKSQVNDFLRAHGGSGVQHIALHTNKMVDTVNFMSQRGVKFRTPPPVYYQQGIKLEEIQSAGHASEIHMFEKLGILLDTEADVFTEEHNDISQLKTNDTKRYLMQVFTQPIFEKDTFFLEVIQRCGAQGFGAGNITALAKSIILHKQQMAQKEDSTFDSTIE